MKTAIPPEPEEIQEPRIYHEKGDLAYGADISLTIERVRVGAQVSISHLARTGRRSTDRERILELAQALEDFVDQRLGEYILEHPTWGWASRVKGIGKENYPKVIGLIEKFARYYDVGDPMIPPFVKRLPAAYQAVEKGDVVEKMGVYVWGIERLATVSKLWKYAGESVENGHAPHRESGHRLGYNSELRMALFRLGQSLMRAQGIWYEGGDPDKGFSRGYAGHKAVIEQQLAAAGVSVLPTPKGRVCPECKIEIKEKKTLFCPQCGSKLSLKDEPPGILFQGHVHQRAMRLMIKDFLTCLWVVWRTELALPRPDPYGVAVLKTHKLIDPWKMVDR